MEKVCGWATSFLLGYTTRWGRDGGLTLRQQSCQQLLPNFYRNYVLGNDRGVMIVAINGIIIIKRPWNAF